MKVGNWELSESDRRLNVEMRLKAVVSRFGGQMIVAGPAMDSMVEKIADAAEAMAREGFFEATPES